jgi:hypothetical protein
MPPFLEAKQITLIYRLTENSELFSSPEFSDYHRTKAEKRIRLLRQAQDKQAHRRQKRGGLLR